MNKSDKSSLPECKQNIISDAIDSGVFHVMTDYIAEDHKIHIALGYAHCDCMAPFVISNRKYILSEIDPDNIISGETYFLVIPYRVIVRQVCYDDWGYYKLRSSHMREIYSDFRIKKEDILRAFRIIGETNMNLKNKKDVSIII